MKNRDPQQLRPVKIETGFMPQAEGSALINWGKTRVVCTASVLEGVPDWLKGKGSGWLTAEYAMLPRSTPARRVRREDDRAVEIRRLIGRSLRAAVETGYLGERTIYVDCDVLCADGGTRTAAVTGGLVALVEALWWMKEQGLIPGVPLHGLVAGVSVGVVEGIPTLDLCYEEDRQAQVDMNVIMLGEEFVEVQGTAEGEPFPRQTLDELLDLARNGIQELYALQRRVIGEERLREILG